jgi:hypothetical protein
LHSELTELSGRTSLDTIAGGGSWYGYIYKTTVKTVNDMCNVKIVTKLTGLATSVYRHRTTGKTHTHHHQW